MNNIREYEKTQLNLNILSDPEELKLTIGRIEKLVGHLNDKTYVSIKRSTITQNSFPLKFAIIDFEGEPPRFCGILISNFIYQFYVKSNEYASKFYEMVIKILHVLQQFYLFSFSPHEARFIQKILPNTVEKRFNPDPSFLIQLHIINVQKFTGEGLIPALHSINERAFDDPLLRNNKIVDTHYKKGHFELILHHNYSCLLSELKLTRIRYLKSILI